jgi:hypothetical protein
MGLSRTRTIIIRTTLAVAAIVVAIQIIGRNKPIALFSLSQHVSPPPITAYGKPSGAAAADRTASTKYSYKVEIDWDKKYAETNDYFAFVSSAAQKALDGDGRAALYIYKALTTCKPIAKQYAHSVDPEADFNAFWASMTKASSGDVDRARKDFQHCFGFIKGDAFAGLPERPGGYVSVRFWVDQASKDGDPIAQTIEAAGAIGTTTFEKSSEANSKSMESAQVALNNAVASKDPAALFQIGQLLSDGHASSDRLQGFAVSIAACNMGYDCTANNVELFRGCVARGECPPGISYADVIKQAVGDAGYAQAYARAQQLQDAMARDDTGLIQKFVQLKPSL